MSSTIIDLGEKYTLWAKELVSKRMKRLERAHKVSLTFPKSNYLPLLNKDWKCELPDWCLDQRNQMTGPADNQELVVKMINSGAPGVMLDLEDSLANTRQNIRDGLSNCIRALEQRAYYIKDEEKVKQTGEPVIFVRPRGLHLFDRNMDGDMSSAFYDVVQIADNVMTEDLRHPLAFYIPKSESAEEALWWRSLFRDLADIRGWHADYIKCMALVESYPLACEMEEFVYNLRDHIIGLNLGRWDYMASIIHYNIQDPDWLLPDRNTIPHNVAFFQNLRELLVNVCHRRGILAIGGMTALFPNRANPVRNKMALKALQLDKHNESKCGFDGAWTGHPDQNRIALEQFPVPNQLDNLPSWVPSDGVANLNVPPGVDNVTEEGTREAIRTCILYRFGCLKGTGASLINGYMEDLATDRIYRLMLAQRIKHSHATVEGVSVMFDEEKQTIIANQTNGNANDIITLNEAVLFTLKSIYTENF